MTTAKGLRRGGYCLWHCHFLPEGRRRRFGSKASPSPRRECPHPVLGLRLEPRLARTALLTGVDGFVYPGMRPAQIVELLGAASRGETLVPRDLFEAFLAEIMEAQADLALTPRQQEFLELIAVLATSQGEIVVRRELLEAFLRGTAAAWSKRSSRERRLGRRGCVLCSGTPTHRLPSGDLATPRV